jgi:cell division transport system permease protein
MVVQAVKSKRRRVSYFPTVIGISLVLFMLGLFGFVVIFANQLKSYIKENVQFSILFMETAHESDIMRLQKKLDNEPYVKSTKYVSREEAMKLLTEDFGEDPQTLLGFNPLPASLEVYMKAQFAVPDSVRNYLAEIHKFPHIKEIYYQETLLENLDRYVKIAAMVLLGLTIIFLIVAIALISSIIRLTLFSKRFLIKSMQLVGATPGFIRKPFMMKAVMHGFIGSVVAILLLAGIIYILNRYMPAIDIIYNYKLILLLFLVLVLLGFIITWGSSYIALNRYLRLKIDDLY